MQPKLASSSRDESAEETQRTLLWTVTRLVALIIGLILLVLVLDGASVHSFAGNSDGATVMLEGQSMSSGNLTLHGWSMTLESFWAVDAVIYALVIRVVGFRPDLLHIVPALIATFVILVGAYLAAKGREGLVAVAGACTVIVLLGLPSPDLAYYFLAGPLHIGTALWCLVGFAGVSRGRFGWGWIVGVFFLAAGLLGDFMMAPLGVIPVLLSGLYAMARERNWRAGVVVSVAAPASIVVALAIRAIASLFGAYTVVNRNFPVSLSQITANTGHVGVFLLRLFGVGSLPIGISGGPLVVQAVHVVGALVCLAGVLMAIVGVARSIFRPGRSSNGTTEDLLIESLLLFGVFGDLVTFVLFSPTSDASNVRYLTPGVIFAVILGGRLVGRGVVALRSRGSRQLALGAATLVVIAFAFDVANYLTGPAAPQSVTNLSAFLESHDLTQGVGDYWSASLLTVDSGGAVVVRPLTADIFGHLSRDDRQSTSTWYSGQPFEFFVYDTVDQTRNVNARSAIAMYGKPTVKYRVGVYRVLAWSHQLVFSSALPRQPDPLHIDWIL